LVAVVPIARLCFSGSISNEAVLSRLAQALLVARGGVS
jgi:hypothetical protein